MVNFYHRIIRYCSGLMRPLSQVVVGKPKPMDFTWIVDMEQSFVATKSALAEATMLVYAHPNAPLAIHSDIAVGAVLQQQVKGAWDS